MANAVWLTPSHVRKQVKRFSDVRKRNGRDLFIDYDSYYHQSLEEAPGRT